MSAYQCHECGMQFTTGLDTCPKCDYGIHEQNRTATMVRDIAHNRQTIDEATRQFYAALDEARQKNYGQLRLIVGGGLIKEEMTHVLGTEAWRENIVSYEPEQNNPGAFLVKLLKR